MNIFEHNGLFKAARITGPKHNYLGIAFSEAEKEIELIEKRLSDGKESASFISKSDLSRVVREAVNVETEKRGRQLFVSKIEFVPTDSPDLFAYAELAGAIATHALEQRD